MIGYIDLKELFDSKQSDLITKSTKMGYWVAYFRTSNHRMGIGKTRKEALENLTRLLDF